jgi:translocation and assembly module TamB
VAKRIAIFCVSFLAIIGLTVAGVLVWITSESGARFVSAELRNELKNQTGLDVTFSNIDLELFPPRIRVRSITAGDIGDRVDCAIEEAEFAPRPIDLIGGRLSIEEIYLGVPRCVVRLRQADMDELIPKDDKQSAKFSLNLKALPDFDVFAVSEGALELHVTDAQRLGDIDLKVEGFSLDVTGSEAGIEVRGLLQDAAGKWKKGEDEASESVENLEFRAAVKSNAVDVRHLSAIVAGAKIRLRDAHVPLPLWPQGPDVADLSINVPLELLSRLPLDLPPMVGSAGFLGQMSARRDTAGKVGLSARGRVNLEQVTLDDFVIGDLDGLVSVTPQGVAFAETEVSTADGTLRLTGNIAFDDELNTEISAYLEDIELGRLLEQVTVSGSYVTQKMTGPVKLKGSLNPLRLDANIRIDVRDHTTRTDSFRAHNPPIALYLPQTSVVGRATITDKFLEAENLVVSDSKSRVNVDVRFNFPEETWELKARSKDIHLSEIKKIVGFNVGGHGPLDCRISGKLDNPTIKGTFVLDNALFDKFLLDHATAEVNYFDGVLSFDGLTGRRGQSHAAVSELIIDFDAPGGMALSTKIEVEQVDIQDLAQIAHIDTTPYGSPTGLLFGRAAIDYAAGPDHFKVEADLVHDELVIFGEQFGPDKLKASWVDGALTVSEFGLTKGRGTISITGASRADRSISFVGVVGGIDTTTINNPKFKKLGLDTIGQAFVVVEGTLDHPTGWADLRMGDASFRGKHYGTTTLNLTLDGDIVHGQGQIAGRSIVVEYLKLNLDKEIFDVEMFVENLDLIHFMNIDTGDHRTSLEITGEMAFAGRLSQEPRLSGFTFLERVEVSVDDLKFNNRKSLDIGALNGRFKFNRTRFGGKDIVFDLKGMASADRIDLSIEGKAGLKSVSSLVGPISRSNGVLDFQLRARGPIGAPSLNGSARLRDGMVRIKGFPHDIDKITGEVTVNPKVVRFRGFTAQVAGGSIDIDGDMHLKRGQIADYSFKLNGADMELALVDDLILTASTTRGGLILRSGGAGQLPRVTGDMEISDLRYTQDIRIFELSDLNVDNLSGQRARGKRPKIRDKRNDVFAYDILLHGTRNIEAHNNLFDVELVIDDTEKPLRLVGTNQTIGFLGQVFGKRGQIRLAGKRFEIKYAAVDFRDQERPENPTFRVMADSQIRDWKVTVTAEGTVDEYELKYASQPYLAREDIVLLILTGLTRAEHGQFGGVGLGQFLQFGPGSGDIPVELRVFSEYSEKAGTETTRLAIGRWITKDIWVSVSSSVGQERDVGAEVDYKINDRFSISADYENASESSIGNIGVDLKFRLEF